MRITSREVEKVDASKSDQESAEQRECIDGIVGVKPSEENK
jgi:hypothetical protein